MAKLGCGLIYCAMLTIYQKEKGDLQKHWIDIDQAKTEGKDPLQIKTRVGTLGNFILMLISNIYNAKPFTHNLPHYFQILARFASLGPEAR
jgi:hypothetical protein